MDGGVGKGENGLREGKDVDRGEVMIEEGKGKGWGKERGKKRIGIKLGWWR